MIPIPIPLSPLTQHNTLHLVTGRFKMYYAVKIIKHRVVHTLKGAKTVTVMQPYVTFCNFALPNHQILRFLCRC